MRLDRKPAASRSPAPARGTSGGVASAGARTPADVVDAALLDGRAEPGSGAPPALSAAGVLNLQRVAGNAAVSGYLAGRRPTVQRWGIPLGGFIPAHPELREGQTGEAVRELQEKLSLATAAGGALTADGDFGPATRRRLRAFRTSKGLGTSPVADAALWTALDAAVAGLPAPVRPVLSVGSTGPDVALAQQKLNAFAGAAAPLQIDGVFTIVMTAFVSAFQAGQHITVNGTVDAATWTKLDTASPGGGVRMEGGAPVEQHVANRAGARASGRRWRGRPCTGRSARAGSCAARRPGVPAEAQRVAHSQGLAPSPTTGSGATTRGPRPWRSRPPRPGCRPRPGSGTSHVDGPRRDRAGRSPSGFRERQWLEEVGGAHVRDDEHRRGQRLALRVGDPGRRHPRDAKVRFTGPRPPSAHGSATFAARGTSSRPCARARMSPC